MGISRYLYRTWRPAASWLVVAALLMGGVAIDRASAQVAPANGVGSPFELSFWESVATSNDRAQLEAYLTQYPNGTFSVLARAKIAALTPAVAAPVVQAPVAQAPAPVAPAAVVPAAVVAVPVAPVAVVPVVVAPAVAAPASAAPVAVVAAPVVAVVAPVAQAAPAQAAAPAAPASLLDQFTALGKGGMTAAPALFTENGPVPPRPAIATAAPLTLPDHFCSAVERNRFHDTVYVPAVAQADRNNEAAIAHIKDVQTLHAQALAAKNIPGANALAREASAYKPFADQAYEARIAMTDMFGRIMAVPITGC